MLDKHETKILRECAKYIVHMRSENLEKRFGLVLGAGTSQPLGFPSWGELVKRIASHTEVNGNHVIKNSTNGVSDTSLTQFLFHHYRTLELDRTGEEPTAKFERKIQGSWRRIIHECLYQDVPNSAADLKETHPYFKDFVDIIAGSELTVNYNFDDTIQQLLLDKPTMAGSNHLRGFDTVWNAALPRKQDTATVLHPNGFLPQNLMEFPSDHLVFSEDSFADQLIESMAGHHASLLHHYSRTTCLFVGLSLSDATLRHLLRQSATINPGHYHYLIQWRKVDDARDAKTERIIQESNFDVYNLITLFLDDNELAALGRLISMDEDQLQKEAEELGVCLKYFYYITGAIGTGKTTSVSNLASFKTYDEWAEARPPELGLSWTRID